VQIRCKSTSGVQPAACTCEFVRVALSQPFVLVFVIILILSHRDEKLLLPVGRVTTMATPTRIARLEIRPCPPPIRPHVLNPHVITQIHQRSLYLRITHRTHPNRAGVPPAAPRPHSHEVPRTCAGPAGWQCHAECVLNCPNARLLWAAADWDVVALVGR
jgi:hypothetical protein